MQDEPNQNEVARFEAKIYGDDAVVRVYRKIRDARSRLAKEYKDADAVLEAQLNTAGNELLKRLNERGSKQTKTDEGTAFVVEEMQANIADEVEFRGFVKEQDDLSFFQKRVKKERLVEWMKVNGGRVPPGINIFRELKINVRAPRKQGDPLGPEAFDGPEEFETNGASAPQQE